MAVCGNRWQMRGGHTRVVYHLSVSSAYVAGVAAWGMPCSLGSCCTCSTLAMPAHKYPVVGVQLCCMQQHIMVARCRTFRWRASLRWPSNHRPSYSPPALARHAMARTPLTTNTMLPHHVSSSAMEFLRSGVTPAKRRQLLPIIALLSAALLWRI